MPTYQTDRPNAALWVNIWHDTLASPELWTVESGGVSDDFIRVTTNEVLQGELEALVNALSSLVIGVTALTIPANGVTETIITCTPALLEFDYIIYRNGVYDSYGGVTDGSLELSAIEAGTYAVWISSLDATGYTEIEAI